MTPWLREMLSRDPHPRRPKFGPDIHIFYLELCVPSLAHTHTHTHTHTRHTHATHTHPHMHAHTQTGKYTRRVAILNYQSTSKINFHTCINYNALSVEDSCQGNYKHQCLR